MSRLGHQVHVVFLQTAAQGGRDQEFEKEFLNTLSLESISYSFIGKEARRKPWLGGLRLRKALRSFNADILHCHLYFALLFSFFTFKVPVIYTHHSFKLGVPKILYRLFDRKVTAYVAICDACRKLLDGPNRRIVHINNAVSKARVGVKETLESNKDAILTCVFVGSLRAPKNLSLLLKSFSELKAENVRLLILGEGPDREKLENLALMTRLDQKVEFLGNRSDVGEILSTSDVFLMSSAWEGLPIALIEATLAGLPVIVTNVGGCAEVVHQCANGFVVDSLEVADYTNALNKMVGDVELRRSFSRNALLFSSVYEIQHSVDEHLTLYEETVQNRHSQV